MPRVHMLHTVAAVIQTSHEASQALDQTNLILTDMAKKRRDLAKSCAMGTYGYMAGIMSVAEVDKMVERTDAIRKVLKNGVWDPEGAQFRAKIESGEFKLFSVEDEDTDACVVDVD